MPETFQNYIDGEWVASETGETFEVRNPANTGEVVGRFQRSGRGDARRAVEAAKAASESWGKTPGPERGKVLRRTAERLAEREDELIETLVREEGKTTAEAAPEVGRAVDIFYYYAEKARDLGGTVKSASGQNRNLYTVREPLGVASLITPWNYPIAIPAWKIAPALATGNAVLFKPASLAPNVARKLVECLDESGLPAGVLNYVTGPGSEVGDAFTTHEDVDAVSFTGSTVVGSAVYSDATDAQKRAQTEMGGKNPTVVMPSGDVDVAVRAVGAGAFGVTGQACTACSRAVVHEAVYDEFVDRIVDYAESLEVGPGLDGADVGPQVSESELQSTLDYVEVGREEGARLVTGGEALDDGPRANGYFVQPTVFADVDPDMRIAQEEIFGPVLSVVKVSDLEEAIRVANDVEYGLSASVITTDLAEANRFVDDVEAGVVKVNEKTTGLELHVPFGGFKGSSSETYREQGDAAIDFYTISKTVYLNY
ncbi:aldehyde dehydrogenase family protein [Halomarina pelagica]|uniref:2,5-dioxovalerate dehydrogenase n=1 Tax=Halomarina pelagica TaxID=2961599 RepID=UPI0020C3E2AE|nr:aldehyde dehydrogenase family protein [Halomarina sp. BND7]